MTPDEEKRFRDKIMELYKERGRTDPRWQGIRESFLKTISKPIPPRV